MDEADRWFRTLDLEPGASPEEVKRAWRDLTKVWHPDRFQGDPRMEAKAEEKLKAINFAYHQLTDLALRGGPPPPGPSQPNPTHQSTSSGGGDSPTAGTTSKPPEEGGSDPTAAPPTQTAPQPMREAQRETRRNRILVGGAIALADLVLFAILLARLPVSAVESLTGAVLKLGIASLALAFLVRPLRPYWAAVAGTPVLALLSFFLAVTHRPSPLATAPTEMVPPNVETPVPAGQGASGVTASVSSETPARDETEPGPQEEALTSERFPGRETKSGLRYQTLRPGSGQRPTPTDDVVVDYIGGLTNGTVLGKGRTVRLSVAGSIPCLTEGLQLMSTVEKARLVCPPRLAYGSRGHESSPVIAPNATLVFDIDLHAVVARSAKAAPPETLALTRADPPSQPTGLRAAAQTSPSSQPTAIPSNVVEGRFYSSRAHALWKAQRWQEAAACFDEALRLNPADKDAEWSRKKLEAWSGGTCTLRDIAP
jgi:FKBP-type peptidyl-prolyl cis-trans isomerase FkpA